MLNQEFQHLVSVCNHFGGRFRSKRNKPRRILKFPHSPHITIVYMDWERRIGVVVERRTQKSFVRKSKTPRSKRTKRRRRRKTRNKAKKYVDKRMKRGACTFSRKRERASERERETIKDRKFCCLLIPLKRKKEQHKMKQERRLRNWEREKNSCAKKKEANQQNGVHCYNVDAARRVRWKIKSFLSLLFFVHIPISVCFIIMNYYELQLEGKKLSKKGKQ